MIAIAKIIQIAYTVFQKNSFLGPFSQFFFIFYPMVAKHKLKTVHICIKILWIFQNLSAIVILW